MSNGKKQVNATLLWYQNEQATKKKLSTSVPAATSKERAAIDGSRTHPMIGQGLN